MLKHLDLWIDSKSNIFNAEKFEVRVSKQLGEQVKAQYIEIEGNGLLSRATLWETGGLILESIDIISEEHVISEIFDLSEFEQIEDKLNWWLGEIVTYE